MGAGDREDHHVQDAAEAYLAWQLQLLAESSGRALGVTALSLKQDFDTYVDSRSARGNFEISEYRANVDAVISSLFRDLCTAFPGEKFEFVNVEKEYRDKKKKGDIEIRFKNGTSVSVSVKNYQKGFKRIQLCSGTWNSFLNNFLFEPVGVGTFVDPRSGETFSGSDRSTRDELVRFMGLEPLVPIYRFIDETNDAIRSFYADSEQARMWSDIASRWKEDCTRYGAEAAARLSAALTAIRPEVVKQRLLVMAGLNFDEELLLLGQRRYLCSIVNEKYRTLLNDVNQDGTSVSVGASGQNLKLALASANGSRLASIDVPFTLQKNGAWHLPKKRYTGKEFHPKENVFLEYGERRPRKSRELSTSTNTYLDLGRLGLV